MTNLFVFSLLPIFQGRICSWRLSRFLLLRVFLTIPILRVMLHQEMLDHGVHFGEAYHIADPSRRPHLECYYITLSLSSLVKHGCESE